MSLGIKLSLKSTYQLIQVYLVQDERKQIFPECMVSFILVNNSFSRGQLQYTDYLIYTNNSDDVNAETLHSIEKGNIQVLYMTKGREWRDFNSFNLLLFVLEK